MTNGHLIQSVASYTGAIDKRFEELEKRIADLEKQLNAAHAAESVQQDLVNELEERILMLETGAKKTDTTEDEPEVEVELIMDDDTEETEETTAGVAGEEESEVSEEPIEEPVEEEETPAEEELPSKEEETSVEAEPIREEVPAEKEKETTVEKQPMEETPKASTAYGTPVSDLKQAISIGDRFLYQRELFDRNGELMQRTITELNMLSSFSEAMDYVHRHFNWDAESSGYELFINALHRRFGE